MPEVPEPTLGGEIRRLRLARAWSQDQLAAAAGLSERTVQRVEQNHPCTHDTLQALAAALSVETSELAKLAPASKSGTQWIGLDAREALLVGVALCFPALLFVAANIAAYELRIGLMQPLIASTPWDAITESPLTPLLVLGGPLIALLLNGPHAIGLRLRRNGSQFVVDAITLSNRASQWLVISSAACLLGILAVYGAMENLGHMINGG